MQIKRDSFVGIWKTILFVVAGMIVGIFLSDPALFGDVLRDEPGAAELDMLWGGVIGAIASLVISALVRRNKANG